jgi:hypothetical protein
MRLLTIAALLIAAASVPVAAVAAPAVWDDTDIVHWRVWEPGHRALLMAEAVSGGARVSAAIKGLEPGTQYRIIGTNESGDCSTRVTEANRTFALSVQGNTQANGTFFIGNVNGGIWKATNFIRIREIGGPTWACRASYQLTLGPDVASFAFSRFVSDGALTGIVAVQRLANGRARVSVAVGDVNGDGVDDISVRGSPNACGTPTGTVTFALKLENPVMSSFKSTTIDLTQNELDGLRSVRIRKLTGDTAQDWFPACRKASVTDLIIDP